MLLVPPSRPLLHHIISMVFTVAWDLKTLAALLILVIIHINNLGSIQEIYFIFRFTSLISTVLAVGEHYLLIASS